MENNYGDSKDYSHVVKQKNKLDLTITNFILCFTATACLILGTFFIRYILSLRENITNQGEALIVLLIMIFGAFIFLPIIAAGYGGSIVVFILSLICIIKNRKKSVKEKKDIFNIIYSSLLFTTVIIILILTFC